MKITTTIINISEWIIIGVMGFCGSFAFTNSNLYALIQSSIASHYPGISPYLPDIIWGIIFLFGFQSVVLRKKGGGSLTLLVVICSLPSLLSYDSINIFNIVGLTFNTVTKVSFYELLGLGILSIVGYIMLSHISVLKKTRLSLVKRNADLNDIEEVNSKSHLFLLLSTSAALIIVALVALLSRGIEALLLPLLTQLSWNVVLMGLGCTVVLAVYLYWLGSRHYSDN